MRFVSIAGTVRSIYGNWTLLTETGWSIHINWTLYWRKLDGLLTPRKMGGLLTETGVENGMVYW